MNYNNSFSDINSIFKALDTLHNNIDRNEKAVANNYLETFQKAPVAWAICHQLLLLENQADTVYHFAAQTLRNKIMFSWHELVTQLVNNNNDQQLFSARDLFLQHLFKFRSSSATIKNMLVQCVSSLVVQFDKWTNPITHLISLLNNSGSDMVSLLISILADIPEQCVDRKMNMSTKKRSETQLILAKNSPLVFDLLLQHLDDSLTLTPLTMNCLVNWINFGEIPEHFASSPLLVFAFNALNNPQLFSPAVESICGLIRATASDSNGIAISQKFLPLANILLNQSLALIQVFDKIVMSGGSIPNSLEIIMGLCKIFTELGESYISFILNSPSEQGNLIVEAVLRCSSFPNREVSGYAFKFWYFLSDELRMNSINDERFKKYFTSFFSILHSQIKYPPDFASLDPDARDEFKKFRSFCQDALTDVNTVIGINNCLHLIHNDLSSELQNYSPGKPWEGIESSLCALRSLARFVPYDESLSIPWIMQLIPQLPSISLIRYTATLVVGRFSSWISHNPNYLFTLLKYVVEGLNFNDLLASSSLALRFLCDGCRVHFANTSRNSQVWPDITGMEIVFGVYEKSGCLRIEDQSEIITGLSYVISQIAHTSLSSAFPLLEKLSYPIFQDIFNLLNDSGGNSSQPLSYFSIAKCLDKLAIVFKEVSITIHTNEFNKQLHPFVIILQKFWNLLDQIFARFLGDEQMMEKICKVWKYTLRGSNEFFEPLLFPLLKTVLSLFHKSPHSCFIYLCGVAVQVFGKFPEKTQLFAEILTEFVTLSLNIISTPNGIQNNPDIVEDFFGTLDRYSTFCPHVLFKFNGLDPIFAAAIEGLGCHHKNALAAVTAFIYHFIEKGTKENSVYANELQNTLVKHGQNIVNKIIAGISGGLPHFRLKLLFPITERLLNSCRDLFFRWINISLQNVPTATDEQKNALVQTLFDHGDLQLRAFAIYEFEAACQGKLSGDDMYMFEDD